MKKLVLTLAIMAMAAIAQEQTFKFPGWGCKDVALLQEQLELAPDDGWKMTVATVLAAAQNPPADFAASCAIIDEVVAQYQPNANAEHRIDRKKQFPLVRGVWIAEAWQFCLMHPTNYDLHYVINCSIEQLNTTPDIYCERVYSLLFAAPNSPKSVSMAVTKYCAQLPKSSLSRQERFEKLQTLNDIYTVKLVEDKAAWGDVIAQIRTVMELYK